MSKGNCNGIRPLEGMTVLDLTRVLAGPFCTMNLADLGARVIKIENPNDPDYTRNFGPFIEDGDKKMSGYFAQYNRNKEAITLNLKEEKAKKILKQMVKKADVLVENYRAGVMDKLQVGYNVLKKENPKLVYVALSGFGQTGPYKTWPSYDNSAQALSGLWAMNGLPGKPVRMGTVIGDLSASCFGTIGLLSAYIHAQKTGCGQLVDVAQLDSSLAFTENALATYTIGGEISKPIGNDHPFVYPYGMFESKDGQIFFGGYTDKLWKITCNVFGEPELLKDPEIDTMAKRCVKEVYERKVLPKINEWFSKYTNQELMDMLADKVPVAQVNDMSKVVKDPQLNSREMFIEYKHGDASGVLFANPIKLSETPCNVYGTAPEIGDDNDSIYNEFLGYSEKEIADLKEEGVI